MQGGNLALMNPVKENISETELRRFLTDQMAFVEVGSHLQRRRHAIERLIAKIHCLSDSEFDAAYQAFESIIENKALKKAAPESEAEKSKKEVQSDLVTLFERKATQTPKRSGLQTTTQIQKN
jgi:hypothetical protein